MKDRKAAELLKRAKLVLNECRASDSPSLGQLSRLEAAIKACEAMRKCGHYEDDDCMCALPVSPTQEPYSDWPRAGADHLGVLCRDPACKFCVSVRAKMSHQPTQEKPK